MMRPLRCFMNALVKALVKLKAPFKFVLSTVSHSSSLIRINRLSRVTPALLTRISSLPVSSRIDFAAASTALVSETSTAKAQDFCPNSSISFATLEEFSLVRETQTTWAPIFA